MASRLRALAQKLRWGLAAGLGVWLAVSPALSPPGLLGSAIAGTLAEDAKPAVEATIAVVASASASGPVSVSGGAADAGDEYLPQASTDESGHGRLGILTDSQPALDKIRLSDEDVQSYRRIFERQAAAAWGDADAEINRLRDRRLLGYVLRQRYLHPAYAKVGYDELRFWLKRYGDEAGADRIYALAEARQPRSASPLPDQPNTEPLAGALEERVAWGAGEVAPRSRSPGRVLEGPVVDRIEDCLREGRLGTAIKLLGDDSLTRRLSSVGYDTLRARIAAALFYGGNPREALVLASASAARSGSTVSLAYWIAGLAAWRLGDIASAEHFFGAMAEDVTLAPWEAAAAAYWAARAEIRHGHADRAEHWLERAARYDRTFYGLIARRGLGRTAAFHWRVPPLTARHLAAIAETASGYRAIALLQVGEDDLAEQELRRIRPGNSGWNPMLAEALVALADQAGLPALGLQIGNAVATPDGGTYDAVLYPLPHWSPSDGFTLDRALLFAIMRQESRFEPRLVSRAGAAGLMQLMPETARDMGRDLGMREIGGDSDEALAARRRLFDPKVNLALGQRYMASLLGNPLVAGNLIHLAVAYNAGPTNLASWRHELGDIDDPLLFVESVPMRETRDYIHKVLANLWIYQMRFGQPFATLDAMVGGSWPLYQPGSDRNAQAVNPPATQVAIHDENN